MSQVNFNPSEAPSREDIGFDPLPPGEYKAIVTESDVVVPKSGDGQMMKLKLEIVEGQYKGRYLFENLCVEHSKEKVAQIAQARLREYCEALSISMLNDTQQLHDRPFLVTVKVTPAGGGYDAGNAITKVVAD